MEQAIKTRTASSSAPVGVDNKIKTCEGLSDSETLLRPSLRRRRPTTPPPPSIPRTNSHHPKSRTAPSIPTPFEYDDDDDFRGYFDFDKAWVGMGSSSSSLLSLPPPSSASLRLPSPRDDQEYYDIMYKLDLGVESPYLGSAYADEAFSKKVLVEESGVAGPSTSRARETEPVDRKDVDCRMCLAKAVLPCRTRCCDTVFCRGHLTEWLRRKESLGLCPSCDKPCILTPALTISLPSRSSSPPRSRTSSTASTSSSSTRITNSTLSCPSSATINEDEEEDMWDVKRAWKKKDGMSLDLVEMVRDVIGESIKFVGLNGPRSVVGEVGEVGLKTRMKQISNLGSAQTITPHRKSSKSITATTTPNSSSSSPTSTRNLLLSKVRQLGLAAFGRRVNGTQNVASTGSSSSIPKHTRSATFGEADFASLSLRRTGSGSIFTVPHQHLPSSFFSPPAPPPPLFASSSSSLPIIGTSRPSLSLTPTPTPTPTFTPTPTPTPTPTTRTTPNPLPPVWTASQTSLVSSSKASLTKQGKKTLLLSNRLGLGGTRVKKHASQEKRLDKAEQSKKAFIKQWLRSVSAANASGGRSDDDDLDSEVVLLGEGVVHVGGGVEGSEGDGDRDGDVEGCDEEDDVEVVDVDVDGDGVDNDEGIGDEVVEVVLDYKPPLPIPPPVMVLPPLPPPPLPPLMTTTTTTTMQMQMQIPSTPVRAAHAYNTPKRHNSHKKQQGCVRYLNLRQSGYTPEEEKMFLVSSLVLRSGSREGRRRSSPALSVLGQESTADTSPPADVIMIGSSDASGSVIEDGERMEEEEDLPDGEDAEEEEIQVVETWPWNGAGAMTTTRTTPVNVKQRSSHGSLGNRSNTTSSAARRRALKRARLKDRIKILGGAAAPLPPSGGVDTRTGTGAAPRSRPGRRARPAS